MYKGKVSPLSNCYHGLIIFIMAFIIDYQWNNQKQGFKRIFIFPLEFQHIKINMILIVFKFIIIKGGKVYKTKNIRKCLSIFGVPFFVSKKEIPIKWKGFRPQNDFNQLTKTGALPKVQRQWSSKQVITTLTMPSNSSEFFSPLRKQKLVNSPITDLSLHCGILVYILKKSNMGIKIALFLEFNLFNLSMAV